MSPVPSLLRPLFWWVRLVVDRDLAADYRRACSPSTWYSAVILAAGIGPTDAALLIPFAGPHWVRHYARVLRGRPANVGNFGILLLRGRTHRGRPMSGTELATFLDLDFAVWQDALEYAARTITTTAALTATVSRLPVSLAYQWVHRCGSYDLGHLLRGLPEHLSLPILSEAWAGTRLRAALATQGPSCDPADVEECARRLTCWLDQPQVRQEMLGVSGPTRVLDRIVDWTGIDTPWLWVSAGYAPTEASALAQTHPDPGDLLATMAALRPSPSPP